MGEVRVHHPGDQHSADVGAAQRGQDEEGDRENGNGRLHADLTEGPARVRRVRYASRPPPLLEGDEVEPEEDGRRCRQPDNRGKDRARNDIVDDLHRQDRARGQKGDEPIAPAEDPPAGPQSGQGEHQEQAEQEQQVGLIGKGLQPLEEGRSAALLGEERGGSQQQQAAKCDWNRREQVAKAGKAGGNQEPSQQGGDGHGRHQPAVRVGNPLRPLHGCRHRPAHRQRQQQEEPRVPEIEGGEHSAGAPAAKREAAVLVVGTDKSGSPRAAKGGHQQYKHAVKRGRVTIPGQMNADLDKKTEKSI